MPFYLMPTLGGNDTLRGFREYRFRGPHAILLQAEYRWEIWIGPRRRALLRRRQGRRLRRSDLDFKNLERTTASGSASTPTTASSSASTRDSGAAMANTCTSSSAAFSKRSTARRCGAGAAGSSLAVRGLAACVATAVRPRRASIPTTRSGPTTTRRSTPRRSSPIEDTNGYDFVVNTFGKPGERRDVRAMNVNTLDEVPDSSWFTNRIGRRDMSIAEIVRGPDRVERLVARRAGSSPAASARACSPDSA